MDPQAGEAALIPAGLRRIQAGMREASFAPQNRIHSASLHGEDTYGLAGWRRGRRLSQGLPSPLAALPP